MITVSDLIIRLASYAAQNPENGSAEVLLKFDGDVCLEFSHANDARCMPGQHYLVLVPNENGNKLKIRELRVQ